MTGNGGIRALTRAPRWLLLPALAFATFVAASVITTGVTALVVALGTEWNHFAKNGQRSAPWPSAPELPGIVVGAWIETYGSLLRALVPDSWESWVLLGVLAVLLAAPLLISAPALGEWKPGSPPRSMRGSVIGAGILGGACAVGIALTVWDLLGLIVFRADPDVEWRGMTGLNPVLLVPAWVAFGCAWAWAIARAGGAARPDRLDRMVRRLFAGTCLELAIAAPTYAWAMRRDSCYCSWGSWTAIVAGTATLVILCGPALVLLATRQARLQWIRSACPECGYPRREGATRCPECGTATAP
jgi:hypothetical protein